MRLRSAVLLILAGCPSEPKPVGDGPVDTAEDCADAEMGAWYTDADGDGYGDPEAPIEACTQPPGTVDDATDCDDTAAAVNPGAEEIWYDGADEDCSGGSDFDQDGDGYDRDEECDDLDPERSPDPGVEERWYDGVDDNCDGNDGDRDGDGFYLAEYAFTIPSGYLPGDCADDPEGVVAALNDLPDVPSSAIHPGAADPPYDGIDANCAGDDDFDADRDGFRTDAWPDADGALGEDCDDGRADTYPGAVDAWYDGEDADCRGNDDFDQDDDGVSLDAGDCDDTDAATRPGAIEACATEADEDCDGSRNGATMSGCAPWYLDGDGDGFGGGSVCACAPVDAYTAAVGGDCDDADALAFPGAPELCDGLRNDCDDGSWTIAYEAGVVSWEDAAGGWSDVSAEWSADGGAVAAVALPDAGTVWVCPGEWYVLLAGPSGAGSVRVSGRYGAASTVLHGGSAGSTVSVAGAGVSVALDNLSIMGGRASEGGGIAVDAATVTVTDCVVEDNQADHGGGIYVVGGGLTVVDSRVEHNEASIAGGGISASDAELVIEGAEIVYNDVQNSADCVGGGVVWASTGAAGLSIVDSEVSSNLLVGGGMYAQGGGVHLTSTGVGAVSLSGLVLDGNGAYGATHGYAGAVWLTVGGAAEVSFLDLSASGNAASGATIGYGGAIYVRHESSAAVVLEELYLSGNVGYASSAGGGGLVLDLVGTGEATLSASTVRGNVLVTHDGASTSGIGGGVFVYTGGPTVTIDGSAVLSNDAYTGDGLLVATSGGSTVEVRDTEVAGNSAIGVMHLPYDSASRLLLDDSRVYDHATYGVFLSPSGGTASYFECVGTSARTAGVYANASYGIAGSCVSAGGGCFIQATGCDLGAEGSGTDNASADLVMDGVVLDGWGDDATFSCVNSLCL